MKFTAVENCLAHFIIYKYMEALCWQLLEPGSAARNWVSPVVVLGASKPIHLRHWGDTLESETKPQSS